MRVLIKYFFYTIGCLGIISQVFGATFDWNHSTGNVNWNRPVNWSGGAVPTSATSTTLNFGTGASSNNNLSGFTLQRIRIQSSVSSHNISGNDLDFGGTTDINYNASGASTISNNFNLQNNRNLQTFGDGGTLTLSGNLSDGSFNNGRMTKFGSHTLILSGSNDFGSRLRIREGIVESASTGGLGFNRVDFSNADGVETTLRITTVDQSFSGRLRTENNASGVIEVDTGITFTVNGSTGLFWNNAAGVLKKQGEGTLVLDAAGSGNGSFFAQDGVVLVQDDDSFGSATNGVTIESGAEIQLDSVSISDESLAIAGTGTSGAGALQNTSGNSAWEGDITLSQDATIGTGAGGSLSLDGATVELSSNDLTVSGVGDLSTGTAGLTIDGTGDLDLQSDVTGSGDLSLLTSGTTTLAASIDLGQINLTDGTLLLDGSNLIGDSTDLSLTDAVLNTNGNSDSLGQLSLSGSSQLAVGGNTITFGSIAGAGTIIITGWDRDDTGIFSSAGVSDATLSQIFFLNPDGAAPGLYGANLVAGNEIVPVPEVSTIVSGVLLLLLGANFCYRRMSKDSSK